MTTQTAGVIKSSRRGFLAGLGATLIVAPSIVKPENIMKVRPYDFSKAHLITVDFEAVRNHVIAAIHDAWGNVLRYEEVPIYHETKLSEVVLVPEIAFRDLKQAVRVDAIEYNLDFYGTKISRRTDLTLSEFADVGTDLKVRGGITVD